MNIIDAIKSGKPFKRPTWDSCIYIKDGVVWDTETDDIFYLYERNLLADDWEIAEKSVTITSRQFLAAYCAAVKHAADFTVGEVVSALHKRLGLED